MILALSFGYSASSHAVTAVSGKLDIVKDDRSGALHGSYFQIWVFSHSSGSPWGQAMYESFV